MKETLFYILKICQNTGPCKKVWYPLLDPFSTPLGTKSKHLGLLLSKHTTGSSRMSLQLSWGPWHASCWEMVTDVGLFCHLVLGVLLSSHRGCTTRRESWGRRFWTGHCSSPRQSCVSCRCLGAYPWWRQWGPWTSGHLSSSFSGLQRFSRRNWWLGWWFFLFVRIHAHVETDLANSAAKFAVNGGGELQSPNTWWSSQWEGESRWETIHVLLSLRKFLC